LKPKPRLELQGIQIVYHHHIHTFTCKTAQKIDDVHLKLRMMLQSRAKYRVCGMPELSERDFCDGLEMKFAQGCSGAGTRGNGVPTPFSSFALK